VVSHPEESKSQDGEESVPLPEQLVHNYKWRGTCLDKTVTQVLL
jgi:hypothetical protein